MGQLQPKERMGGEDNASQVQLSRQQAQGDVKWDHIAALDRVKANFQARANMVVNPNAMGEGPKGNPGIPVDKRDEGRDIPVADSGKPTPPMA